MLTSCSGDGPPKTTPVPGMGGDLHRSGPRPATPAHSFVLRAPLGRFGTGECRVSGVGGVTRSIRAAGVRFRDRRAGRPDPNVAIHAQAVRRTGSVAHPTSRSSGV